MISIIKKFQDRIDEAGVGCQELAQGLRGLLQLRWMFSRPGTSPKPGKFDFAGLHDEFDRSEAAANYMEAIETAAAAAASNSRSGRTRQELAVAKFQSDYLSGMERDMHRRRRSRIRMLAHEATSRNHAGSGLGVLQANVMAYLNTQAQRISGNNGSS
jgi:hypothetical protein